jgi:glycosyltransferase involved in cell wall biosynthesis
MMKVQMRVVGPGDIIHFQYPLHYPFGTVFFLQAALQRARIVFTVHDPIPHKWLLPKWLRWIDYAALTISYRMSSYLIVHSEPGRRMLIDTFGKPASRVVVIPHGPYRLDGEVLSRNSTDCIELLMFGSLRENKGIHLAIGAVQMLYRGGAKVHLTIAGEVLNGSERAYWDVCRALIAEAPAPISLRKGFVPDEELPELFSQCDYVLMPYINFVSDSGVASMALANGRPMIATRTGGLGILLAQADVGFAIEEATVEGVAAAIENALAGGIETARRKGRTAAQHIDQFCGWGLISKHTAELYQVLLSGGHPALPVWQTPSASQERV